MTRKPSTRALGNPSVAALVLAVICLAVICPSSAAGAEWTIGGKTLSELGIASESISGSGSKFQLQIPSLGLTIECKSEKSTGKLIADSTGEVTSTLSSCGVLGAEAVCTVNEPIVATGDLKLTTSEKDGKVYVVLTGKPEKLITTIGIENESEECVVATEEGEEKVTGEAAGALKEGMASEKSVEFSQTAMEMTGAKLAYGNQTAILTGVSTQKLTGPNAGEEWGTCTECSVEPPPYTPGEGYGSENPSQPEVPRTCAGDPINCATGNLTESQTDLKVGGRGPGLAVTRAYNSQLAASQKEPGSFGYGWAGPYSAKLVIDEKAKTATVHHDNGSTAVFYLNGSAYAPAFWTQATLVKEGENYIYTLPDQSKLSFNSSGQLTKETDRNGNDLTLSYSKGLLATVTDDAERKLTFAYNGEGFVESVTDPMGYAAKYTYESGSLDTVTLPGSAKARWEFGYNGSHELTTLTDGRGNTTTNEYSSNRVTLQTDALKRERKLKYTEITGGIETTITEPNGSTTVEKFNKAGLPTSITQASGTGEAATTTYAYGGFYNLTSVTDPNKSTTKYTYDTKGNRVSEIDPNGNETRSTYNSTRDLLTMTTPKGETTTIVRDENGNPETIKRPAPGATTQETTFKYASNGDLESETDPLKRVTTFEYDSYGNLKAQTDPEGNKQTWAYNKDSQLISEVSPRGNAKGAKPEEFETEIEPDAQGRPLTVTDPLGHTTEYAYDENGNLKTVTNGNEHTTTYTYDVVDQRTKVEKANGTVIETAYDSMDRVKSHTDGNEQPTEYKRNLLGLVTEEIDPLERKTVKEYDTAGNLKKMTDAAKRTIAYTYDPGSRLTKVDYSDAATSDVTYKYDKDGNIESMTDATGTSSYTYDQLNRLTKSENGKKEVIEYEYNLGEEQTKVTYPNGKAITRTYDNAGRLKEITDWLKGTTQFSYNADSQLTGTTFPTESANKDSYAYNAAGEMTEVTMAKEAKTLASIVYTRDNNGQVKTTTSTSLPGAEKVEYGYDENERLAKAGETEYKHDPADNPTTIGKSTYSYDKASQLEKGGGVTFTFNSVGERTKATPEAGSATTYGYDQAGNLISVEREKPEIKDKYAYDGSRLRASQTISGSTTYMAWDITGDLPLLLSDGTNSYVYGPEGTPIAQIDSKGTPLYLHHDQLGSTRMLTGAKGENEGAYTYDADGNVEAKAGTATTPLGFNGQYTNSSTGLIYLRARTYDPVTAQFLSVDPSLASTGEPYSYAGADPVNEADPSGLQLRAALPQGTQALPPRYSFYPPPVDTVRSPCIFPQRPRSHLFPPSPTPTWRERARLVWRRIYDEVNNRFVAIYEWGREKLIEISLIPGTIERWIEIYDPRGNMIGLERYEDRMRHEQNLPPPVRIPLGPP